MSAKRGLRLLYILMVLAIFSVFSIQVLADPIVSVNTDISSGTIPVTVEITCEVSGGNATFDYYIDFGDGDTVQSTGTSDTSYSTDHEYASAGNFTVECNVTDSSGESDVDTTDVEFQEVSVNPSISIEKTLETSNNDVGDTVTFEITITNDGDVDLEDVVVIDDFDDNYLDFEDSDRAEADVDPDQIEWYLGDLDVDETVTISIDFEALKAGETTNMVEAIGEYGGDDYTDTDSKEVDIESDDDEDPELSLIAPKDNYYSHDDEIEFKWNVTDNTDPELECNLTVDGDVMKENVEVNNGTVETRELTLDSGKYDWEVTCWDDAGNIVTSEERTVYVNMGDPSMTHTFNLDDTDTVTEYINESGIVYLTVDGEEYTIILVEVYAASIQIEIPELGDNFFIQDDGSITIDLDFDDVKDLKIELMHVYPSEKAKLNFTTVLVEVNETDEVNETNITLIVDENPIDVNETIAVADEQETATSQQVVGSTVDDSLLEEILAAKAAKEKEEAETKWTNKIKNPYYLAIPIVVIMLLISGSLYFSRAGKATAPMPAKPGVPKQIVDYVKNSLEQGVYKGEIESSLVKAGWSESEISRALLFARMRLDIGKKMDPEMIRSDLVAQGFSPIEVREAFTYFNVKLNLEKDIPLDKIRDALVDKRVPSNDINRAVLYSKVMNVDKDVGKEELIRALKQTGWSKDQIKRALFYAYIKNKINEGLELGKIEEELLREGKDQGELKKMIKDIRKNF